MENNLQIHDILLDIVGQVWYYNIKEKLECFLQAVL